VYNDNPFSESQFKTFKDCPTFPERIGSLEQARAFCRTFFAWYNHEHHHTGLEPRCLNFADTLRVEIWSACLQNLIDDVLINKFS
jgi:hypothetical protein